MASESATLSDQRAEEGWASLLVRRRCRSSRRLCGTPATAWFGCKGPPRQHSRRRPEAWLCGHWPTSTLRRSRQTGAYGDVVRLSAATCWLWSCRFSVLVITGPSRSGAYLPDRRPLRGANSWRLAPRHWLTPRSTPRSRAGIGVSHQSSVRIPRRFRKSLLTRERRTLQARVTTNIWAQGLAPAASP